MYYVRYVDPISGTSFDFSSPSLDEMVEALRKAKDEIYFKGYAAPKTSTAKDEAAVPNTPEKASGTASVRSFEVNSSAEDLDEDDSAFGYWF